MRRKIDPVDAAIGAQIREARRNKRLRVEDIIDKLDVYRSTYFYYETGEVSLTMSRFIEICSILGLDYIQVMENAKNAVYGNK